MQQQTIEAHFKCDIKYIVKIEIRTCYDGRLFVFRRILPTLTIRNQNSVKYHITCIIGEIGV